MEQQVWFWVNGLHYAHIHVNRFQLLPKFSPGVYSKIKFNIAPGLAKQESMIKIMFTPHVLHYLLVCHWAVNLIALSTREDRNQERQFLQHTLCPISWTSLILNPVQWLLVTTSNSQNQHCWLHFTGNCCKCLFLVLVLLHHGSLQRAQKWIECSPSFWQTTNFYFR